MTISFGSTGHLLSRSPPPPPNAPKKRPPSFRQLARRLTADLPRVYTPDRRPSARKRGYDSKWEAFAAKYLRRHKWCVQCHAHGELLELARAVDHIVPLRDWLAQGGDKYDKRNMQALCLRCHAVKSGRERAEFATRRKGK